MGRVCFSVHMLAGCRQSQYELYGFVVNDIPRLIEQDCTAYGADGGDVVDAARRYQLMYRYKFIAHSLRPFGYDFHFHPHFAARLVSQTYYAYILNYIYRL